MFSATVHFDIDTAHFDQLLIQIILIYLNTRNQCQMDSNEDFSFTAVAHRFLLLISNHFTSIVDHIKFQMINENWFFLLSEFNSAILMHCDSVILWICEIVKRKLPEKCSTPSTDCHTYSIRIRWLDFYLMCI